MENNKEISMKGNNIRSEFIFTRNASNMIIICVFFLNRGKKKKEM